MTDPIIRLRQADEKLLPELREKILALGDAAIPPLIAVLTEDDDTDEDDDGSWAPIHAVGLLADLKATAAVDVMLAELAATSWSHIIHDRLIQRLPELGAAVVEPALKLAAETEDEDVRHSLGTVLAACGVRDERIYALIEEVFDEDVVLGSMMFGDYGDARALPLLFEAIEDFEPNFALPMEAADYAQLVETFRDLGGAMPENLERRSTEWFALWDKARKLVLGQTGERPRALRVGRNDPCPCGSGKKFKKCCIDVPADTRE